jgi:hypothetical protein
MKLTKSMRETILEKIEKRINTPRREAFDKLATAYADKFFKKRGDIPYSEVPDKFTPFVYSVQSCRMYNNEGQNPEIRLSIPYCSKNGYSQSLDEDKELTAKFNAIETMWFEEKRTISQVLYSCSTTKQLIETMPELADLIPEENEIIGNQVVAIETINKARDIIKGTQNA